MIRRRRQRGGPRAELAAMAAALLLVASAACSTNTPSRGAPGPRDAAASQASLTTIDGAAVQVPSNRPSVLVFLSITCADCADVARTLAQVEAATNATARAAHLATSKARFLGVDMDRGASVHAVADFLHSVGADGLPTVVDQKAALAGRYQVTALSTVLVVDSTGRVTFRAVNPSPAKIVSAVDAVS